MEAAIAPSTRRTHDSVLRKYMQWCDEQDIAPQQSAPAALTPALVGNFLAYCVASGNVMARTLGVYRSALSTAWEEARTGGTNPLHAPEVRRLIDGATRELRLADDEKRKARPVTLALTPSKLYAIEPLGSCNGDMPPRQQAQLAAARRWPSRAWPDA
jgi:hypothetical protein